MSQNVLVINQYYAPDVASSGQLLADLCEGLVSKMEYNKIIKDVVRFLKGKNNIVKDRIKKNMNKSTFLIAGKHAVTEALKNKDRKVLRVFLTEDSKKVLNKNNQN